VPWLPIYIQYQSASERVLQDCVIARDMSRRCICCGPIAVQASYIDKYWLSSTMTTQEYQDGDLAHRDRCTLVVCCNVNCQDQQNFKCAMDFMDRVIEMVPACVIEEHSWVGCM
jgi:hypothetical protein